MGVLQELSLLTGIISKTALPGTIITIFFFFTSCYILYSISSFPFFVKTTFSHIDSVKSVVHVLPGVSGALEMGGEVNNAALLEFQGHINRFQVR